LVQILLQKYAANQALIELKSPSALGSKTWFGQHSFRSIDVQHACKRP
jgi:hypothetical protein